MRAEAAPYISAMAPHPYPITVTVDGHTYRGDWYMLQGGQLCNLTEPSRSTRQPTISVA